MTPVARYYQNLFQNKELEKRRRREQRARLTINNYKPLMNNEPIKLANLNDLQEALRSQFVDPYRNNKPALRKLTSTTTLKDSTPLAELVKLSQLLRSYATKVGILLKPDKFVKENYGALYKELKQFVDCTFYYFSLLPLLYNDRKNPEFLLDKCDGATFEFLSGVAVLCDQLKVLFSDGRGSPSDDDDRLKAIGMIWSSCDFMKLIGEKGGFGILADSIRGTIGLVDDVLNDIDEFMKNPSLGNELDFESGFSSEEEEQQESDVDEDGSTAVALERVKEFFTVWQTNLKMIKLLLSSFTKALVSNTYKTTNYRGSTLDELQKLHLKISEGIDDLIGDVLMADKDFDPDDYREQVETLNKSVARMVSVVKKLSGTDEKRSKWIEVWESKYFKKSVSS